MRLKCLVYGVFWLYIMSPVFVTIISGLYLSSVFHPLVAVFVMLFIACLYWCLIWMPVRSKFYELDKEFRDYGGI